MDRQARYKPQAENDFFADGRNNRTIPANTVARGDYFSQSEVFSEDFYDDTLGDQVYLAGKNLDGSFIKKVPVEVSHELMALGQKSTPSFVRFVMVLLVMATGDKTLWRTRSELS